MVAISHLYPSSHRGNLACLPPTTATAGFIRTEKQTRVHPADDGKQGLGQKRVTQARPHTINTATVGCSQRLGGGGQVWLCSTGS